MTSSTAEATRHDEQRPSAVLFSAGQIASNQSPRFSFKKAAEGDGQVLVVEGVPVFRSGSFRDSMGYQHTWESLHMSQMVSHFGLLRERGLLPDIPVRDGHPSFGYAGGSRSDGRVIGYHTALRTEKRTSLHDGKEYDYLIADYEIIDPEAQVAIKSGLWRSLSAETGPYVSNDEAEFWPVYYGVAYVDIPAVEGLKGFSKADPKTNFMMEENSMTDSRVTTQPVIPSAPAAEGAPAAADAAAQAAGTFTQAPQVHTFTIGGKSVSDFGAVQAHITALETSNAAFKLAADEQAEAARADFVKGLSESGRILAASIEGTEAFAKSLSDEQYAAWKATMEAAPAIQALGQFSHGDTPAPTPNGAPSAADQEVATLRGAIKEHQRAGMAPDAIKGTKSFKRLIALGQNIEL